MRHVRTLGVCLFAVLALGAFVASGAQAKAKLPEFGKCEPSEADTGHYWDANCTHETKKLNGAYQGPYEWVPDAEAIDESTEATEEVKGSLTFETAGTPPSAPVRITCATIRPTSTVFTFRRHGIGTPILVMRSCRASESGGGCRIPSIGNRIEEISNTLEWKEQEGRSWNPTLGFIEGKGTSNPVVGWSFKGSKQPSENEGEPAGYERLFGPIICADYEKVYNENEELVEERQLPGALGSVWIGGDNEKGYKGQNGTIGTVGPVNQMTHELTLSYGETEPGVPSVGSFEHSKKQEYLEAFVHNHWERVAFSGTLTLLPASEVELRATK